MHELIRIHGLRAAIIVLSACAAAAAQEPGPPVAPAALEKGFAAELADAVARARGVRADLQRGATPAALAALREALERVEASDLLLAEKHRSAAERLHAAGASSVILSRQAQMTALARARLDPLRRHAAAIRDAASAGDRAALLAAVDAFLQHAGEPSAGGVDRTPLGVTLPYRSLDLPHAAPATAPAIVPAYLSAAPPVPVAADLAAGPDVSLAGEIHAQARALNGNPIAIFEYVQTAIGTEFYQGAMKGARQTLAERGGNDVDQASLLIALLRASGVPARYVRGVIRLTETQARAWTSVGSARRVAEVLTRAGIPFTPVRQGGAIAAFLVEHTWVEAYVPYANYRGAPLDSAGRAWVPLDPSFTTPEVPPGAPVPPGLTFTGDALVAEYLATTQTRTPLEFYTQKLADHLASAPGGLSLDDVRFRRRPSTATAGLLPSTLPYATEAVHAEHAALPDALRHTVRVVAAGDEGSAFDITLPVSEVLGRRLTLSYVPATVEDQLAATAFLGLDNTPAYLVKVRPVLKVGGVIRAAGESPVQMGNLHEVTIELKTPRVSLPITNAYVAGGYYAIGLAAGGTQYSPADAPAPEDTERPAADRLFRLAADYLAGWNDAERALGALLHVVPVNPIVSEVVVGNVYNRTLLFGQPQAIDWRGVFVDADLRITDPVPVGADDSRGRDFLRMSGLAGSSLEGDVLQRNLEVDAVSAAKLIQLARGAGIPIRQIDASNAAGELPLLQTADLVKADIADAVRQGWHAIVPQTDFTRHAWTGIGYVLLDPATGAAGYFISGGLAGGMSSQDPADWVQQQYVNELGRPYQDAPNADPTAAFTIRKVIVTDGQEGTAGEPLQRPLAVWVRDAEGKPVEGASVAFTFVAGGGSFGGPSQLDVTTDSLGIALATPTLGSRTGDAPFYVQADPADAHVTQVGENLIQARVKSAGGDIALDAPFQIFGFPGPATRIIRVLGDGNTGVVGLSGGTVRARVVDAHDNPISNVDVQFTVLTPVPRLGPLPAGAINMTIYRQATCSNPNPGIGDCNGVGSLTEKTSVFGASIETILGNVADTAYHVSAQAGAVPPLTFTLRSSGVRDFTDARYLGPELVLSHLSLVNDRGQLLNAAEVGTEFRRRLGARVTLVEDEYHVEAVPGTCDPDPNAPDCFRVASRQTVRVRPVDIGKAGDITYSDMHRVHVVPKAQESAQVSFLVVEGGGTTVPATASAPADNPQPGVFFSRLTVGGQPALNRVQIGVSANVWVPRFDLKAGTVHPQLLTMRDGEQLLGFAKTPPYAPSIVRQAFFPAEQQVFGVRARILNPENVLIGAWGGTTTNFDLEYRIDPAEYDAQLADIDLFEVATPADTWRGVFPGSATRGDGHGRIHQGTGGFSAARDYQVQLVLNRGSEAEIRSEKRPLGAYLTSPFGVDFRSRDQTAEHARKKKAVDLKDALLAEKAVLKGMIGAGLAAGASCGVPIAEIAIIEQGSGACFWRPGFEANPVAMCSAFHPKVSDHDYEVLLPDANAPAAACLVKALNKAGEDADLGDVSFFAVSKAEFTSGKLNIDPPTGGGADVTGDLGLGRQSLLLKWALEGEYVTGVPGLPAPAPSLATVLETVRTTPIIDGEPTGIPRLEGFEWATLQEYNFYKSKSHVRLTGAAIDPKSYLYQLQQKELHDAAKAGIRAAMGRLAAHPDGNKLLFITRGEYQSAGGCYTGTEDPSRPRPPLDLFPKICDSFEEHIASSAVRSLRDDLGIFTADQVRLIYQFYRIKADAPCAARDCTTQITTEAEANAFLARTLSFIRSVSAATKGVYDDTLASGRDPRAAQRVQNADRAEQMRAELALSATRAIEDRVVNDNAAEMDGIPLDMYSDAAPGGPVVPWRRYAVPKIRLNSETIVDVVRDANGQPIRDGDGRMQKVFTPQVPGDVTRFVSFLLDPDHRIRECNKADNFAWFFTYGLDPANPVVPGLPPAPQPPTPFPQPPSECTDAPVPSIRLTKLVNRQPHIKVAVRTPVAITHTITNTGLVPVEGVRIADLLVNKTYGPFALAPGATRAITDTYVPADVGKELIGPSEAIAFTQAGVTATAWDSVGIDVVTPPCPLAITQLDPDPNPYVDAVPVSTFMEGGSVYRYYRVHGLGPAGGAVVFTVNGNTRVAGIDVEGYITHIVDGVPRRGLEIKFSDLGAAGTFPVQFVSVNGSTAVCSEPFTVEVTPREFTRGFTAGASIEAAATAAIGLAGKVGSGLGISIDERPGFTRTKLALDRSINGSLGVQAGAATTKAKVLLPGVSGQVGGSAQGTVSGLLMLSDSHEFAYPPNSDQLDLANSRAFGALILSTLAAVNGTNPLLAKLLEAIADQTDTYPYKAADSISVGIESSLGASGGALIGLGATDKSRGMQFGDMIFGLGGGAGLAGSGSALFGVDLRHKDLELVPSFTLKASFDVSGFIGQGSVSHSVDAKTKNDVLKLKDDIKASIKGTYGGAVKAKLSLDATKDYAPKKLSLSIATTKDWGWQVLDKSYSLGVGGDPEKVTYTFTLSDQATIGKVIDKLVALGQLSAVTAAALSAGVLLGPTQLAEEFEGLLVILANADATFEVSSERGHGIVLPIGLELGAGARIEASAALNFDRAIGFTTEKGIVKQGRLYTLERYGQDQLIPGLPDVADLSDLASVVQTGLTGVLDATNAALDVVVQAVQAGLNRIRSRNTAELTFDGATAPFTDVAIASFTYDPVAGPVAPGLRLPSDVTGPADAPHFGVGGFHQFTPKDAQLTAPGTLTFFYRDDEVRTLDESTLAIYSWNEVTGAWEHLGGAVDPAANTITTSVRRLGLFTAAPPLPAGRITLSAQSAAAGSATQPETSVTYTSGVVRMNTGVAVPDGTVFTVRTLQPSAVDPVPFGTITSPDADPLTEGVQVTSTGGVISFTARYPGAFGAARVLVYTPGGVALGDHVITYQHGAGAGGGR